VFVGTVRAALAANAGPADARVALICAAAYGSHLFPTGSAPTTTPRVHPVDVARQSRVVHLGIDVFRQTARLRVFTRGPMLTNVRAVLQEIAILGPTVVDVW